MATASSTVSLKWIDSVLMTGLDSRGRPIVIGGKVGAQPEWVGVKPSDLLLLAAASCSAYDVITILVKQRQPLAGLEVTCTGEQSTEPPYAFVRMHLHYVIKGAVSADNVERAVQLSQEKYCSVIATLRPVVEIGSDFEIIA